MAAPSTRSRTFGKSHPNLTNLSDGSGLAVTVAGYLTPNGRDIQGGLEPDRTLVQPEPLNPGGDGDSWLIDAQRVLEPLLESNADQNPSTGEATSVDAADRDAI